MWRPSPLAVTAIPLAMALAFLGSGNAFSASPDVSGTWVNKGEWAGSIFITQSGEKVSWQISSNNKLYSQTFKGAWSGKYIKGTFKQSEPRGTPNSYTGTITTFLVDDCHLMIGEVKVQSVQYAAAKNLLNLEFTKTPCTKKIVWPPLRDALVSLESVSNGCGGGDAGNDPKDGDKSEYVNSEIPFSDDVKWLKEVKYPVNFREACKQHDAAYSHAKVKEMTLNGGKIIDYFNWTKKEIDDKFLVDMIKICQASIPKTAKIALNNCENYGGFHTEHGAKSRYKLVASTTYSQAIWKGLGFYQQSPHLTGAWTVQGFNSGKWVFLQADRLISIRWTGPTGATKSTGEFHGIIISHDKDSTVEGFYVSTSNDVSSTPRAMSLTWDPKNPDALKSNGGISLARD